MTLETFRLRLSFSLISPPDRASALLSFSLLAPHPPVKFSHHLKLPAAFTPNTAGNFIRSPLQRFSLGALLGSELRIFSNYEAYCEDFVYTGSHCCILVWPPSYFGSSTKPDLAAAFILDYIIGLLWPIDGWHRVDALSNLSPRSSVATTGHCRSKGLLETKRSWHWFWLIGLCSLWQFEKQQESVEELLTSKPGPIMVRYKSDENCGWIVC